MFVMYWLISFFSIRVIPNKNKEIYLTFDDGPEPGITEYILSVLKKYNAKATFFCVGENVEKYPDLIKLIIADGHALGNHSYSHLNGLESDIRIYLDDVLRAKKILDTDLFRPPWGMLTLNKFLHIKKTNKVILWSISSEDFKSDLDWNLKCKDMVKHTKKGSIILFHFGLKHSNNTKIILPKYIDKVFQLGFNFNSIQI